MDDIRAFGRVPRLTAMGKAKRRRKDTNEDEYVLAERLRDAKRKWLLSESQLAELDAMHINILMDEIRAWGRVPRLTDNDHAEYVLAERLRWARR